MENLKVRVNSDELNSFFFKTNLKITSVKNHNVFLCTREHTTNVYSAHGTTHAAWVVYIDISIARPGCVAIFIFNLTLMLACCKQTCRG